MQQSSPCCDLERLSVHVQFVNVRMGKRAHIGDDSGHG